MKTKLFLATFLFGLSASALSAEGDLFVIKSIGVNAPAAKTWAKVAKFGDLGAWHPAVAKTELTNGNEGEQGAKRTLTLQDGGKIDETLTAYNATEKSMSYIITESVLPVSNYASTLKVMPNGKDKSVVVWEGRFTAKAPADEKAAQDTINAVYDAGLGNLKKIVE
jgi:mxaD protein